MSSNFSLVESDSGFPYTIGRRTRELEHDIKKFFLNVGLFFFSQPNDTRRRTLSPVVEFIKITRSKISIHSILNTVLLLEADILGRYLSFLNISADIRV